jgi:RNA polymerase sigma factor (sigma-70 family)
MDAYAYALEHLRDGDFARLRAWRDDGRTRFSTWLVVVVRRLALDHRRSRYGRAGADPEQRSARRRLSDLVGEALEIDGLPGGDGGADHGLEQRELSGALAAAIAALDPPDRLLLALRFEDDLTAGRIAQVLDLPTPFHVYRRLQALFRLLKDDLRRRGVGGPAG